MSPMRIEYAAFVVGGLLLFGTRYGRGGRMLLAVERWLNSSLAGVMVGVLTVAAVWWVWGSLSPAPVVSDEISYLLQAKLFASGRWSAPSPPLPEFFEQQLVLLVPRTASKYPPGGALMLTPGVLLGVPAFVPLLLNGLSALLIFQVVRKVSNGWVAILTWLLWLSSSGNLIYRASYFSEVTTSALWLSAWYATLRFFETTQQRWLVVLAALVGLGAITRPLTMLAFAVPVGYAVLSRIWRTGRWTIIFAPLATVLCILAIIPVWSERVTGNWRQTPLALYTEAYMPWDVPGFGLRRVPATRESPPEAREIFDGFMARHEDHQFASLPRIAQQRMRALSEASMGGWRSWLMPAAVAGLVSLNAAGLLSVACAVMLFMAYLFYAHAPEWVVYYLEAFPILAFLVALGLWSTTSFLAARLPRHRGAASDAAIRIRVSLLSVLPLFGVFALFDTIGARHWRERRTAHAREFQSVIATIPDNRAIVFVRHSPYHVHYTGHVANYAELESARVWLVHDRGPLNRLLREVAPERSSYLYDESSKSLARIP